MKTRLFIPALALAVALAAIGWLSTTPTCGHIESNTHNVSTGHFNDGDALTSGTTSISTIYGTAYSTGTGAGASQAAADSYGIVYTIYECWDRNEDGQVSQADEPIGETTLTAALTTTTTTIPVASTANFLPTGYVLIDHELIKYCAVTGTALLTNGQSTFAPTYTVSGAGTSGVNGTYTYYGTIYQYPVFSNGTYYLGIGPVAGWWCFATSIADLGGWTFYYVNENGLTGTWTTCVGESGASPAPTVTAGLGTLIVPGFSSRGMNETSPATHSSGATVTAVNAWDAVYTCVCNGTAGHAIGWNSSPLTSDNGTEGNLLQNGATIPVANGMHYLFKIRIVDGSGNTNTEVSSTDVFYSYGPPSYVTAPPTGNTQGLANNAVLSLYVSEPPF